VHTLQVPGANKGEAITKDGKYLLLATGGGAKVLSAGDAEQGKVVVLGTLDSPKGGGAVQVTLSPDDQFAFVTLQSSGGVAVFNLRQALADGFAAARFVGTVPTGKESVGVAVSADPGHKWLYVTDWGPPGTISVVNMHLAETDPGKALPAGHPLPAGCQPSRVVTSSHGRYVWVTAQASNALLAFSAARLRTDPAHALIATVPVGKNPIGEKAINHDRQIVVANSGRPHSLMVIDTQQALCREGKRALVGSIATGKGPREFDLADGSTLLVTNLGSGRLAAVSINDIPLTSQPTLPPGQCRNGG
jgi:DNA-binding beta-propeller fold protein YncE